MYNIDFNLIIQAMPMIIHGIKITLFISFISSLVAFAIGFIVVFFRTMSEGIPAKIATGYVEIIRNTPLLIQLYLIYKALPGFGINFSPITCGIIALSVYTGSYISEVLRSGINSITQEQFFASRSLGLSTFQAFTMVIFPQAIRVVISPLGSQFISLVKNSSLVSFIAVTDVFYVIYKGAVDDFRFLEYFIIGAIIYMFFSALIATFCHVVEARI